MKIKTTIDKLNNGLDLIKNNGGRVSINGTTGSVSISGVKARFSFDEKTGILTIVIDDKPWLASESMIEEKINDFFN